MAKELAPQTGGGVVVWQTMRQEIAALDDVRDVQAAAARAKALKDVAQKEGWGREQAFGFAVCEIEAMARGGELIRLMQERGELVTEGRRKKQSQAATISEVLGDGAKNKSSRWQTVAKIAAERREGWYESMRADEKAGDKPSYSGMMSHFGIGSNLKATQGQKVVEWYTPEDIIELVRKVLGKIELDPASSKQANKIVKADTYYSESYDGIEPHWEGRVFLNPPFAASLIGKFVAKLCEHYEAGDVPAAILLTNNNTDTTWWHQAADACKGICYTKGRIAFYNPAGEIAQPTNGHTLFYFGKKLATFAAKFANVGKTMVSHGS